MTPRVKGRITFLYYTIRVRVIRRTYRFIDNIELFLFRAEADGVTGKDRAAGEDDSHGKILFIIIRTFLRENEKTNKQKLQFIPFVLNFWLWKMSETNSPL